MSLALTIPPSLRSESYLAWPQGIELPCSPFRYAILLFYAMLSRTSEITNTVQDYESQKYKYCF